MKKICIGLIMFFSAIGCQQKIVFVKPAKFSQGDEVVIVGLHKNSVPFRATIDYSYCEKEEWKYAINFEGGDGKTIIIFCHRDGVPEDCIYSLNEMRKAVKDI